MRADCDRCSLYDFARFRCDRLYPEQSAGANFCDQLDKPPSVKIGLRTRHVVERQCAAFGFEALAMCLGLGQAHGSYLRISEHHRWHGCQVEQGIAAVHIDGSACPHRCGNINELRLIGAIASSVDIWSAGSHGLVSNDGDLRIDFDARRFQQKTAGIVRPAGGFQQLVGAQLAFPRGEQEFIAHKGDVTDLGMHRHVDTLGMESRRHGLADGESSRKNSVLRARMVTWLPSRAKACVSFLMVPLPASVSMGAPAKTRFLTFSGKRGCIHRAHPAPWQKLIKSIFPPR